MHQALRPKVWAHRGGNVWAPENTRLGFRKSIEAKVSGIELDVRCCKPRTKTHISPEELIVSHDRLLERMTDSEGSVEDYTFDELQRFSIAGTSERIICLDEALALIDGSVQLNIEVKLDIGYPDIDNALLAALANYPHQDKVLVSSFDHDLLRRIRAKSPDLPIAILMKGRRLIVDYYARQFGIGIFRFDIAQYAKEMGAHIWHPKYAHVHREAIVAAKQAGLEVNLWTLNDECSWQTAIELGVDGIVTDDPQKLISYLALK
jgi:glycerophosphoryl diester phosphodiesterase